MTDKAKTKVDISVRLKAAQHDAGYVDDGLTKLPRLALSVPTNERAKRYARQAKCFQEQWLFTVFHSAVDGQY